ncbi:MAG: heparinase II/III family protein [Amaricoccus sp.]|uniref:heparinase II/III family protein n=1 Tax=Amaricoccus sp. TaxID=1872485 RepID=UPI0039E50CF5
MGRRPRAWQNRLWARQAWSNRHPALAETLPEPVLLGDAGRGQRLLAGTWDALATAQPIGEATIWQAPVADGNDATLDPRLEPLRQTFRWLDDLAALGNRSARLQAQAWLGDWIRRYGRGSGPGWQPALAGERAMRWTAHARLLTQDLDAGAAASFWRALHAHQRYLSRAWPHAAPGLPQLQALGGLVWTGLVLPHPGHAGAVAELAALAESLVQPDGGTAARAPEELAEALILLIWTARLLEDAGQRTMAPHLQAILRAVPVIRPLRMGDGGTARFHGGGRGEPERLDQALAELKLAAQPKPALPMGFARLAGGRAVLVMDAAAPPPTGAAGTLAFELGVARQPFVVNAGPGHVFGPVEGLRARATAAHSTVEVGDLSSALIATDDLAARTFGPRLEAGPALVAVRQAQDASGQWLVATHDGYAGRLGLLHERRLFIEAKGAELRGEDILSVPDAGARDRYERAVPALGGTAGRARFAVRFHLHPAIEVDHDDIRQLVILTLPSEEVWMFRAAGGGISIEPSVYYDAMAQAPQPAAQVVVRAEVVGYLGQVTWSFTRLAEPAAR